MKEFATRTITAIVLIAAVYVLVMYTPDTIFSLFLFIVISMGATELVKLLKPVSHSLPLILLNGLIVALSFTFGQPDLLMGLMLILVSNGVYFLFAIRRAEQLPFFVRDFGAHALSVFYLYLPLFFLLELRRLGPYYLFFLIFVIAVGDSGAYFIGSLTGNHKIYPVASPKKSLEGLLAAIFFAGLSGWVCIALFPIPISPLAAITAGAVTGLVSQMSDPVESLFKRAAGVKDSGAILPGHGGILDRMDSYIFCAPTLFYIIRYFWQ